MKTEKGGEKHVIVKMAHISDARAWREGVILRTLSEHAQMTSVPTYLAGYAARPNYTNLVPTFVQPTSQGNGSAKYQSRHLEIYILDVPIGKPLKATKDLTLFLDLVCQLFRVILNAYRAKVIHRDLSSGNVIVFEEKLYVIDWDAGKHLESQSPENTPDVTGTLDTMPIWRLRGHPAMSLAAEAESATYVAIKTLLQICRPTADRPSDTALYDKMLNEFNWDDSRVGNHAIADARYKLWTPESEHISLCLAHYGFDQAAAVARALLQHNFYRFQRSPDYPKLGAAQTLTDEAVAAKIEEHMSGLKSLIADTLAEREME
jgi:hypothetical protein